MIDAQEFKKRLSEITTPLPGSEPYIKYHGFSVKGSYDGWELLTMLTDMLPRTSAEEWKRQMSEGRFTIDGRVATPNMIVRAGNLMLNIVKDFSEPAVANTINLNRDDPLFLAIDKPSPLPLHPCGRYHRNCLIYFLEQSFPEEKLKLVHRLDANTTGILLLAKGKKSAQSFITMFEKKEIKKSYLAVVEGIIIADELQLNHPVKGHQVIKKDLPVWSAETAIKVLQRDVKQNRTMLKIVLGTGRTNQIRWHLASIGHPIIGDNSFKDQDYVKNNPFTNDHQPLFLHANRLQFQHPITTENIVLHTKPPSYFPKLDCQLPLGIKW